MAVFDRFKFRGNPETLHLISYWLYHIAVLSVVAASLTALILVAKLLSSSAFSVFVNLDLGYCDTSGNFVYNLAGSELLPSSGSWFALTLLFGNFEFSAAKAIDIAFDIVVGRGLQVVFAYGGFKTFSKALTHIVEREPQGVSYDVFESLAFNTPSMFYVFRMTKSMFRLRGRNTGIITWIIFASIYILAFPTLTSAMSGYTSVMQAFVVDSQGSLVHWDRYEIASFTVHEASRVNLAGNSQDQAYLPSLVDAPPVDGESSYDASQATMCTEDDDYIPFAKLSEGSGKLPGNLNITNPHVWDGVPPRCKVAWEAAIYISKYGHNVSVNMESVFNGTKLPAPTLQIECNACSDFLSELINVSESFNGTNLDIGNTNATFDELNQTCFTPNQYSVPTDFVQNFTCLFGDLDDYAQRFWNGELYNVTWFRTNGQCQPTKLYSWGFSYIFLLVVTALTFTWVLGMYILWLYIHLSSRVDRVGRGMGIYRASLDLADAIRRDVGAGSAHDISEKHIDMMSDKELRKRVAASSNHPMVFVDAARNADIMQLETETARADVVKNSVASWGTTLATKGRSSKQSISKVNLLRPDFFQRRSTGKSSKSTTFELLPKTHDTDEWDHSDLSNTETGQHPQDYDSMRR